MEEEVRPDPEKARSERAATISEFFGVVSLAFAFIWPMLPVCLFVGPVLGIIAIALGWREYKRSSSIEARVGALLGLAGMMLPIFTAWCLSMAFP